ncbi:hypothetical protein [Pseudomonas fluorescens]|uniref:hypothetical protein n=1 Tax=Pseudomonas fluorescens TaxID=294 RepID=UPI0020C5201C|nr:hypothetical protein [Pseudomonas fluorescens]UTL89547.1 hypothetical protein NLL86_19050 [Pseudomonas fluorescens]
MSEEKNPDHGLLILAAKAAGIEIEPCSCRDQNWPFRTKGRPGVRGHWNPLVSDGDALKIAVILHMDVEIDGGGVNAYAGGLENGVYEPMDGDLGLCARRAIVRVAAALGEME